jgi:hypothetical protein
VTLRHIDAAQLDGCQRTTPRAMPIANSTAPGRSICLSSEGPTPGQV